MPSFSPAAERNRGPILDVLARLLPARATVLEIASGTGQHAAHFAAANAGWQWQPTEADVAQLPAIAARCAGLGNVRPPLRLDVLEQPWPDTSEFDAVYCANLLHIAPWPAGVALVRGAARCMAPAGSLVLYGPCIVDGEPTAPSNVAFDADLRERDRRWGLRRLADVTHEAMLAGLELRQRFAMPAHNLMLVFRKTPLTGNAGGGANDDQESMRTTNAATRAAGEAAGSTAADP